jgi:hypothetical protein
MHRVLLITFGIFAAACAPADQPASDAAVESASAPAPGAETADNGSSSQSVLDIFAASNDAMEPIESTVVGVTAAPTVWQALEPAAGALEEAEGGPVTVRLQPDGANIFADILREALPDDAVAAEHIRLEFRREPEGWFATNAWRRVQCRRGDGAGDWTRAVCP